MANIRVRLNHGKPVFNVQVRRAGFPSRTATFPNRRLAERWAAKIEVEMAEGRHFRDIEARHRTLADAIDRYTEHHLPQLRNGRMNREVLPYWRMQLGHLKLCDITPALLVEHRDKLFAEPFVRAKSPEGEAPRLFRRKPNTVNNYLRPLSRVFTLAKKEWHWITVNPMEGVSKLPTDNERIRYLTEDERTSLLAETAKVPQLHVLVVLALTTAARAGELLKMSWRDVEFDEGRAILRHTKNGEPRGIWLYAEALKLLRAHREAHPDEESVFVPERHGQLYNYREPFIEACQRAGVKSFHFHDLRQTAATYLARLGATEQQLKAIGGWKSNVANRYVHLAAEDAKELLERMNNKILGPGGK
jgi:integrase